MNFFMKNVKNRYSDPDPDPLWNRIRIHFFQMWIRGSESTITERWIRGSGSGSTFPKCGSQFDQSICNSNPCIIIIEFYRIGALRVNAYKVSMQQKWIIDRDVWYIFSIESIYCLVFAVISLLKKQKNFCKKNLPDFFFTYQKPTLFSCLIEFVAGFDERRDCADNAILTKPLFTWNIQISIT